MLAIQTSDIPTNSNDPQFWYSNVSKIFVAITQQEISKIKIRNYLNL